MPPDQNDKSPVTSLSPEQQQALTAHAKDVADIIEIGRKTHGTAPFDDASAVVRDALGERTQEFTALIKGFDNPDRVIMHLANNPDRLAKFAKLNVERQAIELSRIEAQFAPHGHVPTGADPLWRQPERRHGRVSDEDWARTFGAELSDSQWHKEFSRRQAERRGRR